MKIPRVLLETVLGPAARAELAGRFDADEIRALLNDAFATEDVRNVPPEPSVGGRIMVRLAMLTVGFYGALIERGLVEEEARVVTARVSGRVYDKMATVPTALSMLGTGSRWDRLRRATNLFRAFPFSPPSYQMVDVVTDDDVVAFDVHRCPVAEYFRAQDLGALCVESWCNLDYPLAQRWGSELERTQTIAGGACHCDFRWRVIPQEP